MILEIITLAAEIALTSYFERIAEKYLIVDSDKLKQSIESLPTNETIHTSSSIPCENFYRIIKNIEEENYLAIANEIKQLLDKYEKPDDLTSDFKKYVNALNISPDQKDALISFMKNIQINMENLKDSFQSLNSKTTKILNMKGIPRKFYDSRIEAIYSNRTKNLRDDYQELINRSGLIYMDICSLNYKLGIIPNREVDAGLIFMIAGRAKDKSGLSCVKNKTKDQLAYEISETIKKILH